MKFIIRDEERRYNALNYIKGHSLQSPLEVSVRPYKKNRSRSQNNVMWMWYDIMSHDTGMSIEELHETFKVKFLGVEEKEVEGELLRYPKSSTNLTTIQMAEFLIKIEMTARELNIVLLHPDDYHYALMKDK